MKITDIISPANHILIIGHSRPDGDALGAGLSLLHIAEKMGKPADFVCDSAYPQAYSFMHGFQQAGILRFKDYDTVICVDSGDVLRLGKYYTQYFNRAKRTFNIDHHVTNTRFAAQNLVLPDASGTCEILGKMYIDEGLMDKETAELIYVGLSTDTGHFMHDNTSKEVFGLVTRLFDYGIDSRAITRNLYRSNSYNRLRLLVKAINSMRFFSGGRVCVISLTATDLEECGCTIDDTENIISHAVNLKEVQLASCVTQSTKNGYKVSFRSKAADVAQIATRFGGGGHKYAAGCMLFGQLEDVLNTVRHALTNELD